MAFEAQLILIPMMTVSKIVLISVAGFVIARTLEHGANTVKGLTYISIRILLPCMLFANLCLAVTWSALGHYFWGPVMSVVPAVLGYLVSLAFSTLLDNEWHGVLMLGCTFQNGLIFPLSVILNLKGIEWLTGEAFSEAQQLMFFYNILSSAGLWAIGEPLVKSFKEALDAEAEAAVAQEATDAAAAAAADGCSADAITAPHASPARPPKKSGWGMVMESVKSPPVAASLLALLVSLLPPLRWVFDSYPGDILLGGLRCVGSGTIPIQLLVLGCSLAGPSISLESPVTATAAAPTTASLPPSPSSFERAAIIALPTSSSPAALMTTEVAENTHDSTADTSSPHFGAPPPRSAREHARELGGAGRDNRPNASNKKSSTADEASSSDHHDALLRNASHASWSCRRGGPTQESKNRGPCNAVVEPDSPSDEVAVTPTTLIPSARSQHGRDEYSTPLRRSPCVGPMQRWLARRVPPATLFTVLTCILRLVLVPAATFAIVHILVILGLMPTEKPFLLSLLIGISSPSAINSSLICSMYNYKVAEYARMIFVMYLSAIVTATLWLILSLCYVERYGRLAMS